jgi:hypothetical protein
MWNDEIVEETRKARDEYGREINYDLAAIYKELKELQNRAEHKVASLPPKKPVLLPQTKAS